MALLRRLVSLAAVCLCAVPLTGARDIVGAVNLDSYTLDKVAATHDVLVRFDRQHAYGDKEDVFKDLALKLRDLDTPETFLLAYVGVQEYQDKLNKAMAEERFGVSKADWPTYKLLLRSQPDAPLDYDGPITVDALLTFLAEKAGLAAAVAAGHSEL